MARTDRPPRVVILGAGATGLGTGLGLALHGYEGQVLLIERKTTPGGLAGSFRWKSHTVDHGPHRLSPNITRVRVLAEELLGPDCLIKKSQHGVQFRGKLYQFPPRVIDWITPLSLWHAVAFAWSTCHSRIRARRDWCSRMFRWSCQPGRWWRLLAKTEPVRRPC